MQRKIERLRRWFAGTPRVFAGALAMLILAISLFSMVLTLDLVTVTDSNGNQHTLLTASREPEEIVQMVGLTAGTHDEIVYTEYSENAASVVIRRAMPISVVADEIEHEMQVVEGTVADALQQSGVQLSAHDFVEPGMATLLQEGMQINVNRVSFEEAVRRTEVAEQDVEKYQTALNEEQAKAFVPSRNGIYDVTYRDRYVNGEVDSSEIVALAAVIQPRDAGSTAFIPGVPCSTIAEFDGVTMNPDGTPANYSRLMQGAVTTAYSSSGGRGSSGLGLYCGTVAVNPNVIPYGTRLYITSADNSFVYGYAIATDTGTALMEGRVDIDLYFATNEECLRFGKRGLNVYILD